MSLLGRVKSENTFAGSEVIDSGGGRAHLLFCPSSRSLDMQGGLSNKMETPTVARDLDSGPGDMERVRAGPLLCPGPVGHTLFILLDPDPSDPSAPRMSFLDFLGQFSRLEICNLSPDSLSSEELHQWDLILFNGRWTRGSTAGGCANFPGEAEGGLRGPKSLWPVLPRLCNASACSLAPGAPQGPCFSLSLEARAAGWTVALQPPAEA